MRHLAIFVGLYATSCAPNPQPPPILAAAPDPVAALAALDARTPVRLLPQMALHQRENMKDHLLVIQQITDGLAREDWPAVESAASRIASSPEMQMQCEHMGQGADGFTEAGLDFHRRADAIVAAAKAKDAPKALAATADTLAACTGCHSRYREEVVTEAEWTKRTGTASPMGNP